MLQARSRNFRITVFVIFWLLLFNYESLRTHYLSPLFGTELPKFKFLFPPAGWIMFYRVSESEVRAEVYGQKGTSLEPINPHRIFGNRWIGYDNIRRNVLVSVLGRHSEASFCRYLKRKFPQYDSFVIMEAIYPSSIRYPDKRMLRLAYQC